MSDRQSARGTGRAPAFARATARLSVAIPIALAFAACSPGTTSPSSTGEGAPSPSASIASATPTTPAPPTATPSAPPATSGFDPNAVQLDVEVIVGRLTDPLDIAVPLDNGLRYVAEQAGRIRVVRDGELLTQPLLDIRDRIASGGERGLLGLAFHPDFPDVPRLFVDYTDESGDTVVSAFDVSEDLLTADPDSEQVLIQVDQPFPNHNGGAVVFGPDGMLYIALGDGGSGGDPQGNGQRLDTLLGKILRIDVDGAPTGDLAYAIPADNPFPDSADARPEIWLTGLRNPWRMRIDSATGDLWIGDVGQSQREEIDRAPAGEGGLNFGWNRMEGSLCFEPGEGCDRDGLTLPVAEYATREGCAVIGGVVVRDQDQPLLSGGYVFSDACTGAFRVLDAAAAAEAPVEPTIVLESGRGISAIGLDADGTVLATDLRAGELLRIVATPR